MRLQFGISLALALTLGACDNSVKGEGGDTGGTVTDDGGEGEGEGEGEGDADGDGYSEADGDCNDDDDSIHPGASETCNEIDDDCDGDVDENASDATLFYMDEDGDGYGNEFSVVMACALPEGASAEPGDCDDTSGEIFPGAEEVCNGRDDDCDLEIDEDASDMETFYTDADSDSYGDAAAPVIACDRPAGTVAGDATDCDDTDDSIHPGADEVWYDGVDSDCAGDDDHDADGDGHSAASGGGGDCDDTSADVHPGTDEYCDAIDWNCDGSVSDGAIDAIEWWADLDGDGYGGESLGFLCSPPVSSADNDDDCDDTESRVNPGADELCDGVDTDCDPSTGEDGLAAFVNDADEWEDVSDDVDGTASDIDVFDIEEDGTLYFCAGTWYTHIDVESANVEITGLGGRDETILDASDDDRVIAGNDADVLTVSDLTLRNGNASGGTSNQGGCVTAITGDLILQSVTLQDCYAEGYGGGAFASANSTMTIDDVEATGCESEIDGGALSTGLLATMNISNSSLSGNTAANGGAVALLFFGTVTITDTDIESNTATGSGGGVYIWGGYLTVDDSTVDANTAFVDGGGVYVLAGTFDSDGSTFSNNVAESGDGGGVYLEDIVDTEVVDIAWSSISDNTAYNDGGGITVQNRADVVLDNTSISGNSSYVGGGMVHRAGSLEMDDTVFRGNTAWFGVGGLYAYDDADGHDDYVFSCTSSGSARADVGFLENHALIIGAASFDFGDDLYVDVDGCDFGSFWGGDGNTDEGYCPDFDLAADEEACWLDGEETFVCDSSSCVGL